MEGFQDAATKAGEVSSKALKTMAIGIAAAATALLALGASTKEYRVAQAQLNTAFIVAGSTAEVATQTYNDLYRVLGDTGQATEAAQHLAMLTQNQQDLSEWTSICQGVYATFGSSLPIESLTEAANETAKTGELTGALTDALIWAGVNEDDFKAKLLECNDEAEREALIRETLSGLYGDAAAQYEKTAASVLKQNEAEIALNNAMAELGEAVTPINTLLAEFAAQFLNNISPAIQAFADEHGEALKKTLEEIAIAIGKVLGWIIDNWDWLKGVAAVVIAIAAAISLVSTAIAVYNAVMAIANVLSAPVILIIGAIIAVIALLIVYWDEVSAFCVKAFEKMKEAVSKGIEAIKNFFMGIINWIKENWQALLLLLVNPFAGAFKLLYDNCEGFRNTINNFIANIKNAIQNGFNAVKEKIITPIQEAFNKVKSIFTSIPDTMRNALNKAKDAVKSVIDKIKGFFQFEWSLPKLKVPKFSISPAGWKVGDLLEGVIPKLGITWNARGGVFDKPTLMSYGNSLQGIGENGAEAVVPLENNLEWLDKLADMLSDRMGNGTPVILQVDGKTFADTVIRTVNRDTRQKGKLALNIM